MSFDPEKITFFAKTDARGQEVSFGIKAKDRQRHMYVVGKTGMGKSTLLENMAAQDIKNGEGMAFIDPHGSAAETLLDYVPEHRVNDVIYFAPFDMEHPISFNVMEDVGADKRHLVVSGLMSTFKKIWVDAWSARMEYILTNALLVLIEYPDTTLLSVNRLFSDKAYRKQVVEYCKDPAVKAFWVEEFANYTERFAAEALPSIQNKIGQFTGNPLIRNIIGQPHSSFDIRDIMDNKKILIMNLSKGLIGETNANLLGSMLTTRIYLAAMSRADLPVAQMKTMPNFYFYVDEFQSFANATFANILSEARKYHLNLIIAHQYIAQMEEEVRDAVFGNVGTTVSFRVGPFDGEVLETVFTPRFVAADLVNLGFAQIYLTLMIDGIGSQPFSAVTLPPVQKPEVSSREMVIAASRKNYTKNREVVEKVVADLHTPVKVAPPPKKNNNLNNPGSNGGSDKPKREFVKKEFTSPSQINKTPTTSRVIKNENQNKNFAEEQREREVSNTKSPAVNNREKFESKPFGYGERSNKRNEEVRNNFSEKKSDAEYEVKTGFRNGSKKNFQKTPEDLRAILGRISAEQNNKSKNGVNDYKKTTNNEGEKNSRSETLKADLKNTLEDVLKKVDNKSQSTDQTKAKNSDDEQNRKVNTNTTFVSRFDNYISKTETTEKENGKQEHRQEIERLAAEVESIFGNLEAIEQKEPVLTKVVSRNENQSYGKSVNDDPLSPKRIEKMFKHPNKEKSPFSP